MLCLIPLLELFMLLGELPDLLFKFLLDCLLLVLQFLVFFLVDFLLLLDLVLQLRNLVILLLHSLFGVFVVLHFEFFDFLFLFLDLEDLLLVDFLFDQKLLSILHPHVIFIPFDLSIPILDFVETNDSVLSSTEHKVIIKGNLQLCYWLLVALQLIDLRLFTQRVTTNPNATRTLFLISAKKH